MKKCLNLLKFAVVALTLTACSISVGDEAAGSGGGNGNGGGGNSGPTIAAPTFVGAWYEEAANEYVKYEADGTFYDRYSGIAGAAETNGRWEYDAQTAKYTTYYTFLGQQNVSDFTVRALKDNYFVIYSQTAGEHKYEKVVESVSLPLGETVRVSDACDAYIPDGSTDSHIATMNGDGVIKSEGGKGTAFISLKDIENQCNVWVKVTVGDDCLDPWIDFTGMLGADYSGMLSFMKDIPNKKADDNSWVAFTRTPNAIQLIKEVTVFFDDKKEKVKEVQLDFPTVVTQTEIEAYLKSRYFLSAELGEGYYTTDSILAVSSAILYYDKEKNIVSYLDKQQTRFGFPDYTGFTGYTEKELYAELGKGKYNGYLPYFDVDNIYVSSVFFHIDSKTKKVTAFQLDVRPTAEERDVKAVLDSKFHFIKEAEGMYGYYDGETKETSKWQVAYNPEESYITFIDLENYGK